MARADGRIEPGQSLKSAISARAWNRAQDAADIVLGERTRFGATAAAADPQRVVVPCMVFNYGSTRNLIPGMVVSVDGVFGNENGNIYAGRFARHSNGETFAPSVAAITARVVLPVQYTARRTTTAPLGVVVGGVRMPVAGANNIVDVCVSGLCSALCVRRNSQDRGGYLQTPLARTEHDTAENLSGVGEQANCGNIRIVGFSPHKAFEIENLDIRYAAVIV
jgi:hypothetical protein